jgi:eukaryotic-like serine/threonine-protein kinase
MAEAFLARRPPDSKLLVVKRVRPDLAAQAEYIRRFTLEAQIASHLSHPNLVRFLEFGQVGHCHYIVMEHVRGYSLQRLLNDMLPEGLPPILEARPPLSAALHLGAGILDGLSAMHAIRDETGQSRPMLHRDVTPSNVIVTLEGRPVLIDFGIAKDIMGPELTVPGVVIGTARYMAPEHRRAEYIDPRADVFSASVIMYELIVGEHPWPVLSSLKEILRSTFDPPELSEEARRRVPEDIVGVLLRGLACDVDQRYPDAAAMSAAIKRCGAFPPEVGEGTREVLQWIEARGLNPDETLDCPVVDYGNSVTASWRSDGTLSDKPSSDEGKETSSSRILQVPPLPPRRDSILDHTDVDIDPLLFRGRRRWVWPIVFALGVLLFSALLVRKLF